MKEIINRRERPEDIWGRIMFLKTTKRSFVSSKDASIVSRGIDNTYGVRTNAPIGEKILGMMIAACVFKRPKSLKVIYWGSIVAAAGRN